MGKIICINRGLGGKRMATIFDVANYFILKANSEEENPMTPLKLQKLCYYAQGWNLAWDDRELFNDDFEAWVHGPANYSLYKKYNSISRNCCIDEVDEGFNVDIFCKDEIETLDTVWDAYGKFSGTYLEQLTHQEDPWKTTRGQLPPGASSSEIISKDTIKKFFLHQNEKEN